MVLVIQEHPLMGQLTSWESSQYGFLIVKVPSDLPRNLENAEPD